MSNSVKVKITSWNCRGLGKLVKIKQVLSRLKQKHANIIFLQETHMMPGDVSRIRKRWQGQVYSASFSTHARGVLILIHRTIPFQVESSILDPKGRFIILQGSLLYEKLNLVNIYGPNIDDPFFFDDLFLTISTLPGNYIIGGDFNVVLDPKKDKSAGSDTSHTKARVSIANFMKDLNLSEIWRELNPHGVEYSCHSSTHKTYSRIDYFLISTQIRHKIKNCQYDSIVISDHAPISITYHDNKLVNSPPRWRFHTKWLQDSVFIDFIGRQIDLFFELNTTQTSASIRWEAFKAFLRGQIISFTSPKLKHTRLKLEQLDSRIKNLEKESFLVGRDSPHQELLLLRTEYNKLSAERAANNLLRLKQAFYDQGEKSGKLLAWRIRQLESERAISIIENSKGEKTTDPKEINDTFREFYESLYSSEYPLDPDIQTSFLDKLDFPNVSSEAKNYMDTDLTVDEIIVAIDAMKANKAAKRSHDYGFS